MSIIVKKQIYKHLLTLLVLATLYPTLAYSKQAEAPLPKVIIRLFYHDGCKDHLSSEGRARVEKVKSLYGLESRDYFDGGFPRYYDKYLNLVVPPEGKALTPKKHKNLSTGKVTYEALTFYAPTPKVFSNPNVKQEKAFVFHTLRLEDNWYHHVAHLGKSLVAVKIQRPKPPEMHQETYDRGLNQEKYLLDFLFQNGIPAAQSFFKPYFDLEEEKTYLYREYVTGPNATNYEDYMLSTEMAKKAEDQLKKLKAKIKDIQDSETYKKFAEEKNLYHQINISDENYVYSNGKWRVIGF